MLLTTPITAGFRPDQIELDAYRNASTDTSGGIDNRTIIVLALAGLAAVFFMMRKG